MYTKLQCHVATYPTMYIRNTQCTAHVVHMLTLRWCTGGSVPHCRGCPIPLITRTAAESVRKAVGCFVISTACPFVPWRNWGNGTGSRRTGRFSTARICIIAIPRRVVNGTGTTWRPSSKITRFNDLIETIIIIHGIEVEEMRCLTNGSVQLSIQLIHLRYLGQEEEEDDIHGK